MDKKSEKNHLILNLEDTQELLEILSKHGAKKDLAKEVGVTRSTVSSWMKKGNFPQYCGPFLKNRRLLRKLAKMSENDEWGDRDE